MIRIARLRRIDWPDYVLPDAPPPPSLDARRKTIAALASPRWPTGSR